LKLLAALALSTIGGCRATSAASVERRLTRPGSNRPSPRSPGLGRQDPSPAEPV